MADNIFDISFDYEDISYSGWVNPSDDLNDSGKPVSFHVVLNGVSFGYLFYHDAGWHVNERRPRGLVECAGTAIEQYYNRLESERVSEQ
jgi:hypothetical protein